MASRRPQAAAEEGGIAPKGKSRRVRILILGVVVIAVVAGGIVGWTVFLNNGLRTGTVESQEVSKPIIREWDTFLVNLADPGGKRYLKLIMKVELEGAESDLEFTERTIPLRDTVLVLLSNKEFDDISTSGGKMSLKMEIIDAMNRIMQRGRVREVYFTEFLVQ